MSQNNQWDGLSYTEFDFPYDLITPELSPDPRLTGGENSYVTTGGKLTKRFGTTVFDEADPSLTGRIDRLITYETMGDSPKLYLVASVYNATGSANVWSLWYKPLTAIPGVWAKCTNLRESNSSEAPHEMVVSGGLLYVKGLPSSGSGEKLGSIILDGTTGSLVTYPWGLLGPQTPARVNTVVTTITTSGGINSTDTSFTVASTAGFPGTPTFRIQVEFELMLVTSVVGTTLTVTRGFGGTTPASHPEGVSLLVQDWTPSNHPITVNYGWTYAYAYKTITGQISNRSPLETNPDLPPSTTGPFFDLQPRIYVVGNSDTTNIPTIIIYRTTDGGGTFYQLDEITNTGAPLILYTDNTLESGSGGGVFADPIPDDVLDQFNLGPSLVSNSPPPATVSPNVTGTDPVLPFTRIAIYQSRLWYGIENILFYSAQEELNEGIPEESWPSGSANGRLGNFFRFQSPITNLQETEEALYVFTADATYKLTGSNRETFSFAPAYQNIGSPSGQSKAVTRYNNTVAFLSHDYRIYLVTPDNAMAITDPLGSSLTDLISANTSFEIKYFADLEKEWVIVTAENTSAPENTRVFVYDVTKSQKLRTPFWNTPWSIRATGVISARVSESRSRRQLLFTVYNADTNVSELVKLDLSGNTGSDYYDGTDNGFAFSAQFHQMLCPAGNHVNQLRVPGITPNVYGVLLDRLQYPGDSDPTPAWFFDDLWTDPEYPIRTESPARRIQSKGYRTIVYSVNRVAQHFSASISKPSSKELFGLLGFRVIWEPDGGA